MKRKKIKRETWEWIAIVIVLAAILTIAVLGNL